MKKKKFKLIVLAALCLALVIGTCAVALAIDPRNVDEKTSLTVNFWLNDEDVPAPGVEFRLYYVADVDEFCNMTVAAPFTGYGIDLSEPTQQTYTDLENMLPGNIAADGISPNYTAKTDENGAARFEDIPEEYVVFGEVGLGGEIRSAFRSDQRIAEAKKLGFLHAIGPATIKDKFVVPVKDLRETLIRYVK